MYNLLISTVALFTSVTVAAQTANIPTYIKACHINDPNLSACALKNGKEAIPHLIKGDKSLGLPSLLPLVIPKIVLQADSQLSITLTDVKVTGFENAVLTDMKANPKIRHTEGLLSIPKLTINGNYDINGRLLIIPIQGKGPAEVVCEDLVGKYNFDYKLSTKADGKEYIDEDFKSTLNYTVGKVTFKFDNLFNGDKNLGDKTNEFLNEHSSEINKDFASSITDTVKYIIDKVLKNFVAAVPYDQIFLP